jgi:hypothetical protein
MTPCVSRSIGTTARSFTGDWSGTNGARLAVSATTAFGSAEDARRAAGDVRLNAGSADGTEASG